MTQNYRVEGGGLRVEGRMAPSALNSMEWYAVRMPLSGA